MIEAVIFDVDGTLIDSVDDHASAWQWALERYGHSVPWEKIRFQIGKGGDQLLPVFLAPEEIDRISKSITDERSAHFQEVYLPHLKAFPQVRELFLRIKRDGKKVVLASSAKPDELKAYQKLAGIDDLIEHATSSGDAEKSKPHPDIVNAALGKLDQIDPSRVIYIGDTPWDAIAASKAGVRTIGMLCGGFAESHLREAGCVAIFESPADLLARYDQSPLGSASVA